MKKGMLIGGGIIFVLIIGVVVYFVTTLDSQIKRAINTYGPEMTKSEVHVKSVGISIFSGEGSIKGLFVGNPKGFTSDHAFKLGLIKVAIDTDSVTENPVVINSITIIAPEISFEQGSKRSNLDQIQRNINSYVAKLSKGSSEEEEAGEEETKLIIKDLYIKDAKVKASGTGIKMADAEIAIPDIHLKNIGTASGGATGSEIATQVISALTRAATKSVVSANISKYKKQAEKEVKREAKKGIKRKLKGMFK